MTPDSELLARYVADGSQDAFGELAARYLDMVFAAARRQAGRDSALAEDISQAVFLMLARKARTLRGDVIVSAWLLRATWYASHNALRIQKRRRLHEATVVAMNSRAAASLANQVEDEAPEMSAMLDRALMSLRERDRAAVAMHYLRGQTFEEVAAALHTTPQAARKRVQRAILKLRDRFASAGAASVTPAAVTSALIAATNVKAPPKLLAAITSDGPVSAVSIARGALRAMTFAQAKGLCAAVLAIAACVTAGVAVTRPGAAATTGAAMTIAVAATLPAGNSAALDALQRSAAAVRDGDGETMKSLIALSNPADGDFVDQMAENIRLARLFESAYRKAFGNGAPEPLSAEWKWSAIPDTTPVFITGDRARIPLDEGTVQMVMVDGQWKLPLSGVSLENQVSLRSSSPQAAQLARLNNIVYSELTDAIEAGRIKSPEQARTELRNRLERARTAASTAPTTRTSLAQPHAVSR